MGLLGPGLRWNLSVVLGSPGLSPVLHKTPAAGQDLAFRTWYLSVLGSLDVTRRSLANVVITVLRCSSFYYTHLQTEHLTDKDPDLNPGTFKTLLPEE